MGRANSPQEKRPPAQQNEPTDQLKIMSDTEKGDGHDSDQGRAFVTKKVSRSTAASVDEEEHFNSKRPRKTPARQGSSRFTNGPASEHQAMMQKEKEVRDTVIKEFEAAKALVAADNSSDSPSDTCPEPVGPPPAKKSNKHRITKASELMGDAATVNRSASRAVQALAKQAGWACEVLNEYNARYRREKGVDQCSWESDELMPDADLLMVLEDELKAARDASKRPGRTALNLSHLQAAQEDDNDETRLLATERLLSKLQALCLPLLHNQRVLRQRLHPQSQQLAGGGAKFVGFLAAPCGRVDEVEEGCLESQDDFFFPLLRAKYAASDPQGLVGLKHRSRPK